MNCENCEKCEGPNNEMPVMRVDISIFSDGHLQVNGPIKNPLIMMDIFGKAMGACVNFVNQEMEKLAKLEGNGITVPQVGSIALPSPLHILGPDRNDGKGA